MLKQQDNTRASSALETKFLNVIASRCNRQLIAFVQQMNEIASTLRQPSGAHRPGQEPDKALDFKTFERISLMARMFAACESHWVTINDSMVESCKSELQAETTSTLPGSLRTPSEITSRVDNGFQKEQALQLNSGEMRIWLFDHIDHPFPSGEEKSHIVHLSEVCGLKRQGRKSKLTLGQCTLWFINARRRSGWTAWARRFGDGDRSRIRAIVAAIQGRSPPTTLVVDRPDEIETRLEELVVAREDLDRHLSKHELAELCCREFQKVIDWIQQGPGQKVGDWMDEIAAEAKTLSSKKRNCGVDDDDDEGKARKVVRDTRSARQQVAEDEGSSSSTAHIEEVEETEPLTPSRQMGTPRRDFSGPSTCSYSSFSSFFSGNTMANSSTTSLTSFDEGATHPSCPVTAFDDSPPLVSNGSSGESSPSASYESPPALTPDAEAFVRRYLEEQRAQNAESMAASAPHTARPHSPPPPERLIRKLPARGVAQAQYSEGNIFRPPVTAQAATGANWGLPATPASIRSTNTSRQASSSSDTPDYGGWLPFVGED